MRFTLFLCCLIFISAQPAIAQKLTIEHDFSQRELDTWKNNIQRFTNKYDEILNNLYKNPQLIDGQIAILRSYYPRTRQYSPFAKHILDKMTKYAASLETISDMATINKTLISYQTLVNKHLVNFEVLSFAITMSQIDVRFGDALFYKKIRKALINNFNRDGMGIVPETAYNIVSYGEETYILEHLGGKISHSEVYKVNKRYYNVHDMVTKEGEYRQIFMNVTDPIKNVLYNQVIREQEDKKIITIQ